LQIRREARLAVRIVRAAATVEGANASHSLGRLRARRERPRGSCTAKERNKLTAFHA
jgi:hypothetical protein